MPESSGFTEGPILAPDADDFYGRVAVIATKGTGISKLASVSSTHQFTLHDREAVVFAGTRTSLTKALANVNRSGVSFMRQSGTGLALLVNRTGSKARSIRNFAVSAKAVTAAKFGSRAHVGGVSNMYDMSKTYAKTFTAIQIAAMEAVQIPGLVGYWDEGHVDFEAVFNHLVECGFINTALLNKRPSKLASLFEKKGSSINVNDGDFEFLDDDDDL